MSLEKKIPNIEARLGELENRMSAVEIRVSSTEEYQRSVANALDKLGKKRFFYSDMEERNWMIYCAINYLRWNKKVVSDIFNITTQQVGNIVNDMNIQYGCQ